VVSVENATSHIEAFIIDNVDWVEADDSKKLRILNVAERTVNDYVDGRLPRLIASKLGKPLEKITRDDYVVPSEAIYELAATLARVFNDTNRMQQHGIAGFSITGVGSFTFKESNVKNAAGESMHVFITREAIGYIEKANDIKIATRVIKDVIM
jgi:hypothetical protein